MARLILIVNMARLILSIMKLRNIFKGKSILPNGLAIVSLGIIKFFFALLIVVLGFLYCQTEIFDFSSPKASSKSSFYNPYKHWIHNKALKSNFHAHSTAWKGITNGHNSENQILDEYKKLGFSVAAVSNYHSISDEKDSSSVYIPCYEHGFNTNKTHILAIDAKAVDKLDFPIGQGISQKQTRLMNIKKTASLVALTHPGLMNGYTAKDLKVLKGYDLFEVLSPYYESFELWDYALNNGSFSWIMANDDTHDLVKQPAGRFFNLVAAESKTKAAVIAALKSGNHVAYSSEKGKMDVRLNKIELIGNEVSYFFSGKINRVKLVKNGEMFTIDPKGKILLSESDKYIRFEVIGEISSLYTNPILRINEEDLAGFSNIPYSINIFKTFAFRVMVFFASSLILFMIFGKKTKWFPKSNFRSNRYRFKQKNQG
jgi:hypothetical protein